jgi:hypothetical protein
MSKARSISDLIDDNGLIKAEALAITSEAGEISVNSLPTIPDSKIESADDWNTAYGWGDHASAGYQDAASAITTSNIASQTVASADKLTTARNIALSGDVSGSASFDGSANITITATIADDSHNHIIANVDGLQTALDGKVDKVTGKGLSTEDYTTAEKSKLAGIESGAEVNTVDSVAGKTGAVTLVKSDVGLGNVDNTSDLNKPISSATQSALNLKVAIADIQDVLTSNNTDKPLSANQGRILKGAIDNINTILASDDTTLDELQEIVDFIKQNRQDLDALGISNIAGLQTALDGKVDKITGKGLSTEDYTTAEKNKLAGIESGAQVNVATNLSLGTRTTTAVPVNSSTGTNVSLPAATTSLAGVMTSADKTKLDGIAAGAQVNVGTNLGSSGTGGTRTITSSTGTGTSITYTAADVGAPSTTGTGASGTWGISITGNAGTVSSITSSQVTTALGYTPYNSTNPSGYINSSYSGFMLRSSNSLTNPNTQFDSSAYRFDPNANNPTNDYYAILTYGNNGNVTGQLATHFQSGETFTRAYNSSWSAWRTQLDSSNYNSYSPTLTGGGASGTWGISITGNAASASSVAWGNVSSKPSNIMYYQGFTLNADTMDSNATGFTYGVGAPATGPVARFSAGGSYDLWINAPYTGGNNLFFRTRNGDFGSLNPWRALVSYGVNFGDSLYGTILYDSDNSAFYCDPAGTSNLNRTSTYIAAKDTNGNWNTGFQNTPVSSYNFHGDISSGGPAGTWWFYESMRHSNPNNFWGTQIAWGWEDNANRLMQRNVTSNSFSGWVEYLNTSGRTFAGDLIMGSSHRAPIFYDSNDTGYYVDPNSLSRCSAIAVENRVHITEDRFLYMGGTATSENSWGSRDWTSGGHRYYNARSHTFNNDGYGSSYSFIVNASGNVTASVDIRAPIFYDSNNTAFYCDPASTSNTNAMRASEYRGNANVGGTGEAIWCPAGIYSGSTQWFYGTMYRNGSSTYHSGGDLYTVNRIVCDHNYGEGLFGVYSDTRYQHVWSMGTPYKLASNGTSVGNLYGLSWTHPNVGTGTDQAIAGLSHQLQLRENGSLKCAFGAGIWTSGNVTAYSDIAVKTNLQKIPNALTKVMQINGYTYDRTDFRADPITGIMPEIRQAGVVAQEVEKILPEVVSGSEGNKAVAYGNMVALLIEAIKEQQTQIEELTSQINTLKEMIK